MPRLRSSRAHEQVLDAALKLFAERGIDATSMDSIAAASGVSKATIYKHWPDKGVLCLEVVASLLVDDQPRPDFDSGNVREDLVAVLAYEPPKGHLRLRARIMPHLMAYAARNPHVGEACRRVLFDPSRAQLRIVLERGIAQGLLPQSLDIELSTALLVGPMMHGHMLRRLATQPPPNLAERVVEAFWKSHAIG